jgi:hypothetical protein
LNSLADQDEPLEAVYAACSEGNRSQDPAELLPPLFALSQMGFVVFRQEPIRALGLELASRAINPAKPSDIVGDCMEAFEEFRVKRDYLAHLTLGGGPDTSAAGVPFGIWVEMTPAGRAEWDRPQYAVYWEE